jgi:hypothetical protein
MATKEIADSGFECAATSKRHKRISATGLVGTCTNASPSMTVLTCMSTSNARRPKASACIP